MTTLWGLPAHALLMHAVVVLAPLTAALEILCGFWADARRRLVWLVVTLAGATTILTPLTTGAGEWLYDQRAQASPVLQEHAERGGWIMYFAAALLVVALAQAALHLLEGRSDAPHRVAAVVVAIVALIVGVSSIVTVVRIGHPGAQSVWGGG